MTARLTAPLLALLVVACADLSGFDGNPQMSPGQACLSCHAPQKPASGLNFNVAGTVFPVALATVDGGIFNATVDLVDAKGRQFALQTNGAGNFYTADDVTFPITVSVTVAGTTFTMQQSPPNGDCNTCHALQSNGLAAVPATSPGFAYPPGRIYAFASDGDCTFPATTCPSSPPSFSQQILPLIEGNCLPCHQDPSQCANTSVLDGGQCGIEPTLTSYLTVSETDYSMAQGCRMPPPGAYLFSPDEFQVLSEWLSCGLPNN